MSILKNKNILLGVTGSIAAYKVVELIRLLRAKEANVKVIMTPDAKHFITELSLQAVCGEPVYSDLLNKDTKDSMSHISLAKWADLLLVAPATANIMAKFSMGLADDLLSTLYLASSAPSAIAPAMNQQMWNHSITKRNLVCLIEQGVHCLGPGNGSQACGDFGPGRMLEPIELLLEIEKIFQPKILAGLNITITAGPTREPIDSVRFISNYSSGKMGYALALAAEKMGAKVTLISGPTQLIPPLGTKTLFIETAQEMYLAVMENLHNCHIFIANAAVADYRCVSIEKQKIKKPLVPTLKLETTLDILKAVSQLESPPFLVGFAVNPKTYYRMRKLNYLKRI